MNLESPEHFLPNLSNFLNLDLYTKRDDLIPYYLGGNKVRKNTYIYNDYVKQHGIPDAIITVGSTQSNHARVCALLGSSKNIEVHLILHGPAGIPI